MVFAEELAPLLDPPALPSESSSAVVDETWVLPAVLQLKGEAVVTENGDICYQFPVSRSRRKCDREMKRE